MVCVKRIFQIEKFFHLMTKINALISLVKVVLQPQLTQGKVKNRNSLNNDFVSRNKKPLWQEKC